MVHPFQQNLIAHHSVFWKVCDDYIVFILLSVFLWQPDINIYVDSLILHTLSF